MREQWQMWEKGVAPESVAEMISKFELLPAQEAAIFKGSDVDEKVRRSKVRWVHEQPIRDFLWKFVQQANLNAFNVDVTNFCEVQYTEYHAEQEGHYDWHHDVHWNGTTSADRKLSVTVQLSSPDAYEGGTFEFQECESPACKELGTVLVFPSYLRHRVLPVTSGVRKSLVAWFHGPRWR